MKRLFGVALLALALPALAQEPAIAPVRPLPVGPPGRLETNAPSAPDTNASAAKGTTIFGCLEGPDKDGNYTLRSMAHRMGVQVVGPENLKNNSGSKVKLTGQWRPLPPQKVQHRHLSGTSLPPSPQPVASSQQSEGNSGENRRFQASEVEVLAQKCKPPAETTPVSKDKPQKPTTYNAPSKDDGK